MALGSGWRLDGNLRDYSGLWCDAVAVGGAATYAPGHTGTGLVCTAGRGASATLPSWRYYYTVVAGGIGVECWVTSLSSTPAVRTAVAKGAAWRLDLSDSAGHVRFVHGTRTVTSTASVLDGAPHHIMVVYEEASATDLVYMLYVDGVQVSTVTGPTTFADTPADVVFIGCQSAGVAVADAVIEDVRIWADPVHPTEITLCRDMPVADLQLAAYTFDGVGSVVHDHYPLGNDLTLTPNGARVTGYQGAALGPVNAANGVTGLVSDLHLEREVDRITVAGRFRRARTGANDVLLELAKADGTPRLRIESTVANGTTVTAWRDDGLVMTATTNWAPDTTSWNWFVVTMHPGKVTIIANGTTWADSGTLPGFYPLNAPFFSGITRLRLGGVWDNLRVLETFCGPAELAQLSTRPLATPTGFRRGNGGVLVPYVLTGTGLKRLTRGSAAGLPEGDTDAPSVPLDVAGSNLSQTGFTVTWSPSVDVVDTAPPSVPTSVAASSITQTGFTIGWSASSDS